MGEDFGDGILDTEYLFLNKDQNFLAGTDEVGRGPLAGPVIASTVFLYCEDLKSHFWEKIFIFLKENNITDSKKLNEKKRSIILKDVLGIFDIKNLEVDKIYEMDLFGGKIIYSIAALTSQEIDQVNILRASQLAMIKSFNHGMEKLMELKDPAEIKGTLLIDGNLPLKLKDSHVNEVPLVKGDSRSLVIGLASIIAKNYRDELMVKFGETYKGYGLEQHMGYPTKIHLEAIKKLGPSPIHRLTFKGVKEYARSFNP